MPPKLTPGRFPATLPRMNAALHPAPHATSFARPLLRSGALALLGSLFIALGAQAAIPLWPVPVTMQTFCIALIAGFCGWRIGVASVALYLLEGALGLPVFANASLGVAHLLGPTGGYLFGFLAAAVIIGSAAARRDARRSFPRLLTAMLLADAFILFLGALWLALFFTAASDASGNASFTSAFLAGVLPFVPGAILKSALAALLITRLSRQR